MSLHPHGPAVSFCYWNYVPKLYLIFPPLICILVIFFLIEEYKKYSNCVSPCTVQCTANCPLELFGGIQIFLYILLLRNFYFLWRLTVAAYSAGCTDFSISFLLYPVAGRTLAIQEGQVLDIRPLNIRYPSSKYSSAKFRAAPANKAQLLSIKLHSRQIQPIKFTYFH